MALAAQPSPNTIHIRPAIPLDRGDILYVNRRTWELCYTHIFSPKEIRGLFQNRLQQHGSWVFGRDERIGTFVAEVNDTVVGFIGIGTLLNDRAGEVTTFYILPQYHGRGVGKRLWDTAVEVLAEHGCNGVWVWVLEKAQARYFYQRRGCIAYQRGTYTVGTHTEKAIGYYKALGTALT